MIQSDKTALRAADSRQWNSHRNIQLKELEVTGRIQGLEPIEDNNSYWYLISRHAGGTHAAYVTQNRLRKRHPMLNFKVVNTMDNDKVLWDGAIYAQAKDRPSD